MRFKTHALIVISIATVATLLAVERSRAQAQTPPRSLAPYTANVQQVMRGILFPNSNVVFAAQGDDPATVKKDERPSSSVNPLASLYGGWEAVSNSALALTESARLLEVARVCSNGKPAPIQSATWKKGLTALRAAGLTAYKAAQAKNQDAILDATDEISMSCATCHDKYREKEPRCTE
jgi:hypothetical protein